MLLKKFQDVTLDSCPTLSAKISILIVYLLCFCSVDSLSVVDLGAGVKHRKVVSLAEGTEKVSSLEVIIEFSMTVYL